MNYDLLFIKCLPLNIDLNWLIYGEFISQADIKEKLQSRISLNKEKESEAEDNQKEEIINIVEMIRQLPWPISTRRIIMENYLYLVFNEQKERIKREK